MPAKSLRRGCSYMKPSADLVRNLNAVKLSDDELFAAINAATEAYDNNECHMMTGVITTMQLFITAPDKAKAIIFRLQALGLMIENDELMNWVRMDGDKAVPAIMQKALVSAAADHPLSLIDGDILFEKDSFLRRVLELAEPEGSREN
jgi:hypothetical protein